MSGNDAAIQKYVRDHRENILAFAVRDYDRGEFLNSITLVISQSEKIQKAMLKPKGQASMYHALKLAAHTGLSLNPQLGEAALAVFNDEISYMPMKNGLIKLAMESKKVIAIRDGIIRENDGWEIHCSLNGDTYSHTPARTDRGKPQGYFAAMKMVDGETYVKYLTTAEVAEHGRRYSYVFEDSNKPWKKSFDGMALKTVIKAMFRNKYISDDVKAVVGMDDRREAIDAGAALIEELRGSNPSEIIGEITREDPVSEINKYMINTRDDDDRIF